MSRLFVVLCMLLVASPATADPKAEADVRVIIGGHFAADHIGPTEHAAITARAKARPNVYLTVIDRLAVASSQDSLSSLHIPFAIEILKPVAPVEASSLVKKLLPIYERALAATPKRDPSRAARLRVRLAELKHVK
jgi:hypothetical protein